MTTFPTKLGFMGRTGTGSMTGPHARPCSRSLTLCRFSRHSAGLKPLTPSRGIVAVVLVTALVVYVLRPSATPTTTSTAEPGTPTVQPPPTDQGTCRDQGHGHHDNECDNATGSGHDSDRDNDIDDHDGASGHSDDNETNDHEGHDGESDQNAGHDSDQDLGDDDS